MKLHGYDHKHQPVPDREESWDEVSWIKATPAPVDRRAPEAQKGILEQVMQRINKFVMDL